MYLSHGRMIPVIFLHQSLDCTIYALKFVQKFIGRSSGKKDTIRTRLGDGPHYIESECGMVSGGHIAARIGEWPILRRTDTLMLKSASALFSEIFLCWI